MGEQWAVWCSRGGCRPASRSSFPLSNPHFRGVSHLQALAECPPVLPLPWCCTQRQLMPCSWPGTMPEGFPSQILSTGPIPARGPQLEPWGQSGAAPALRRGRALASSASAMAGCTAQQLWEGFSFFPRRILAEMPVFGSTQPLGYGQGVWLAEVCWRRGTRAPRTVRGAMPPPS